MKRLLLMMVAVASLTTAVPLATSAFARDGDQGRRAERQERGRPDRDSARWPERGERRGGDERSRSRADDGDRRGRAPVLGYGDDRGRYAPRPVYEPRRRDDDRPRSGERYGPPRPRGFSDAPPPAARRGGYLPRNFNGQIVDDYRRYRLRTPPAGFAWVRVGDGFALVSMADGQIFDMVR